MSDKLSGNVPHSPSQIFTEADDPSENHEYIARQHYYQRLLLEIKALPDDSCVLISYSYNGPEISERLVSAKEAVERFQGYLDDHDVYGVTMVALSEEGELAFRQKEALESQLRADKNALEDRALLEATRLDLHKVLSIDAISIILDPSLQGVKDRGLSAAIGFAETLKQSVERPQEYIGELSKLSAPDAVKRLSQVLHHSDMIDAYRGEVMVPPHDECAAQLKDYLDYLCDPSRASGLDKLLHVGWAEHDFLERAFRSASTVESRVSPAMTSDGKKHYKVEVCFIDKDGKKMTVGTHFNQDGKFEGGISQSE